MPNFFQNLFQKPKRRFWNPEDHPRLLNEDLHNAIDAITKDDNPDTRLHLYQILVNSTFCLPSDSEEGTASLPAIQDEEGNIALIAFSDPPAMYRWGFEGESFVALSAQQLFQIVIDNNFAAISLNPAGPAGGIVQRHVVEQMLLAIITQEEDTEEASDKA